MSRASGSSDRPRSARLRRVLLVLAVFTAALYFGSFVTGNTRTGASGVMMYAAMVLGLVCLVLGIIVVIRERSS